MNSDVEKYLASIPSEMGTGDESAMFNTKEVTRFIYARKDTLHNRGGLLFGKWSYSSDVACTTVESALHPRVIEFIEDFGLCENDQQTLIRVTLKESA